MVIGRHMSPACYIRESFPASLYLAWKYADDFESAVVANTMVGGDNCHRGAVIGALVGAACGYERLPKSLRDGLLMDTDKAADTTESA
jgi:ADP-ribosylglycohydrolase